MPNCSNRINNFSEEDAKSNFAKNKPFPKKKEGFTGPLNCGFAEYEGHLKKDGNPRWYCEHKFAFDYYSVVDEEGNTLYSSKDKEDLLKLFGDKEELIFDYSQLERKISIPKLPINCLNKKISLSTRIRFFDIIYIILHSISNIFVYLPILFR